MSQPQTQTEIGLEEFRQAGVPIEKVQRPFVSKRMTGFNAQVYSTWIERWATNAAANYPVVKGSAGVAFLSNAAQNVPAVVVGIGPSLDDDLLDLSRAPRHAVIIATDAALRPLLKAGIRPDIVLNYDARDEQRTMWDTIDTSPFVLLASSCTSPMTIAAWKGTAMFFNMLQSDDEFATNILPAVYPYLGQLPNMGTVGNGGVYLAHLMGCRPILGVGMDLCYRNEADRLAPVNVPPKDSILDTAWRYRCRDWRFIPPSPELPDGDWQERENTRLYNNAERLADASDETIKGTTYKTDKALRFYRNSLISNIGQLDIPFINCSGGVLSGMVPTMTLRNALETKCYNALAPARTTVKHLAKLIPAANQDWHLVEDARLFVPIPADRWSPKPNEVFR